MRNARPNCLSFRLVNEVFQTLPQAGERWEGFSRALLEILRRVLSKRLSKECGWGGENRRSKCLLLVVRPMGKEEKLLFGSSRISLLLLLLQEAIIENRALWLLLKMTFQYHSKSHYKRLQQVLEQDSAWPPLNETFFSDSVALSVEEDMGGHSNPTFDSNEDALWRRMQWKVAVGCTRTVSET